MGKFGYSGTNFPSNYKCAGCGATKCKLWRKYRKNYPDLLCAKCASKKEKVGSEDIDDNGEHPCKKNGGKPRTAWIGSYVPAIPDEEGEGFWGYSGLSGYAPPEAQNWWRSLPTFPRQTKPSRKK